MLQRSRDPSKDRTPLWQLAGYMLLALGAAASRALFSPPHDKSEDHLPLSHASHDEELLRSPRREMPARPLTRPTAWWSLIRDTASSWMTHKAARLGAALAYYSIFSLGPLVVIATVVAGLAFGQEAVRGEVSAQLTSLLGDQGAKGVDNMLADAGRPREGIFAIVLGMGTLLFATIGVVVQLKDALNTIWDVEPSRGTGIWSFVRTYAVSLAGVLSMGFLLLISLLVTTALSAMGSFPGPLPARSCFSCHQLRYFLCGHHLALRHDVQMAS
jgi:uncharacterized BrkB/YihY/UPF0761 family membrane protein